MSHLVNRYTRIEQAGNPGLLPQGGFSQSGLQDGLVSIVFEGNGDGAAVQQGFFNGFGRLALMINCSQGI